MSLKNNITYYKNNGTRRRKEKGLENKILSNAESVPECNYDVTFPPPYLQVIHKSNSYIHGYITNLDLIYNLLDEHQHFTQSFFKVVDDSIYKDLGHRVLASRLITETNTLRAKTFSQTRKCMFFRKEKSTKQQTMDGVSTDMDCCTTCPATIKLDHYVIFVEFDVSSCTPKEISEKRKYLKDAAECNYEGLETISYIEVVLPLAPCHKYHTTDRLSLYNKRLKSLLRSRNKMGQSSKKINHTQRLPKQEDMIIKSSEVIEDNICMEHIEVVVPDDFIATSSKKKTSVSSNCNSPNSIDENNADQVVKMAGRSTDGPPLCIAMDKMEQSVSIEGINSIGLREYTARPVDIVSKDYVELEMLPYKLLPSGKPVYVFSKIVNLSSSIQKLLPSVEIITIKVIGHIEEKRKDQLFLHKKEMSKLQKAEILIIDTTLLNMTYTTLLKARWIHVTSYEVGVIADKFKNDFFRDLRLTKTVGENYGLSLGEYVLSWILTLERGWLNAQSGEMKRNDWFISQTTHGNRKLKDLTILILGVGNLGQQIAKVLKRFKCQIYGFRSKFKEMAESENFIDDYWDVGNDFTFLESVNYIINVLPTTSSTNNIFGETVLKSARCSPVFINVGSPNVICDDDLLNALENNWLSRAILDTLDLNNIPKNYKLLNHEKVYITPGTAAENDVQDISSSFYNNWTRLNKSESLINEVQWDREY